MSLFVSHGKRLQSRFCTREGMWIMLRLIATYMKQMEEFVGREKLKGEVMGWKWVSGVGD
jgi:hypothetical protein